MSLHRLRLIQSKPTLEGARACTSRAFDSEITSEFDPFFCSMIFRMTFRTTYLAASLAPSPRIRNHHYVLCRRGGAGGQQWGMKVRLRRGCAVDDGGAGNHSIRKAQGDLFMPDARVSS